MFCRRHIVGFFFIYTMNYVGSEIAYPDFTAPNCVGMV